MNVLPENEKVIKLDQDDEGWVDTHHGLSELRVRTYVPFIVLSQLFLSLSTVT